jgi:hypothetical protein
MDSMNGFIPERIGHPILGYVIPAVIFIVSFLVAYLLYRHFTGQVSEAEEE